jgi:hypothetical protein
MGCCFSKKKTYSLSRYKDNSWNINRSLKMGDSTRDVRNIRESMKSLNDLGCETCKIKLYRGSVFYKEIVDVIDIIKKDEEHIYREPCFSSCSTEFDIAVNYTSWGKERYAVVEFMLSPDIKFYDLRSVNRIESFENVENLYPEEEEILLEDGLIYKFKKQIPEIRTDSRGYNAFVLKCEVCKEK